MLPNSSVDFYDCHFSLLFCFNRTTIWSWNQTIHIALLLTSLFPQTKQNWFQKAFHLEYKPFSALSVLTSSLKPYNLTINHITSTGWKVWFSEYILWDCTQTKLSNRISEIDDTLNKCLANWQEMKAFRYWPDEKLGTLFTHKKMD